MRHVEDMAIATHVLLRAHPVLDIVYLPSMSKTAVSCYVMPCYALVAAHMASPVSTSTIPDIVWSGRSTFSPSTAAVAAVNTSDRALHTGTAVDMSGGRRSVCKENVVR